MQPLTMRKNTYVVYSIIKRSDMKNVKQPNLEVNGLIYINNI